MKKSKIAIVTTLIVLMTTVYVSSDTGFGLSNIFSLDTRDTVSDIEDTKNILAPTDFILSQNYPNPFNPETTINYTVPKTSHIHIEIFNPLGQHVKTLVNGMTPVGTYNVKWNGTTDAGSSVSSGVYIYRLTTENSMSLKKMLFVK